MSFFAGFSGEFGRQLERSRAEEAARGERQSAMEASVLQSLVDSPDPEIASHALTGLMDLAGPQKKASGLAGWLGKVGAHPALPTIRQLMQQGRQVPDQPEHLPDMRVEPGMPAGVGEEVPTPGVAGAASAPQHAPAARAAIGPPAPGDAPEAAAGPVPAPAGVKAATPPPVAAFAPGEGYRPATTKTVPRQAFRRPGELEAQQAGEKESAVLKARGDAYDQFAGSPGKQSLIPGVDNQTSRAAGEVQDEHGNWFKQDWVTGADGTSTLRRTPISKVAPKPSAPEAQALERAQEILATTEGLTPEQALSTARAEGRAATLAKVQATADTHTVRLGQIKAMVPATIAAWQRVNGTVPMTRAQAHSEAYRALSASRMTLGGGPDVTVEDITRMADGLLAVVNTRNAPVVSPTREALSKPLAVDAPPASPAGGAAPGGGVPAATPPPAPAGLTSGVPADLAQTNPKPRQLSAEQQERRTIGQQIIALGKDVLTEGEAIGWHGVGGMGAGSIGSFLDSTFGDVAGDPTQIAAKTSLRNKLSHIFAIIAQLQGGKTFTATELKIINRYAPTINQSVPVLKSNLAALTSYVEQQLVLNEQNLERPGKVGASPPPAPGAGPAARPASPASPAGAVPPAVAAALKGLKLGKHTLSDGSVWLIDASGAISPGK